MQNPVATDKSEGVGEIQSPQSDRESAEAVSIKLLGDLLLTLRKNKSMSLLMLARQISKIEIEGKVAVIYSDDKDIILLQTNERYAKEVQSFFESKGLSYKVQEKKEEKTEIDELKRLLGRKLVIK